MRLTDLEPQFFRVEFRTETWKRVKPGIDPLKGNWTDDDFEDFTGPREYHVPCEFAEAHGIQFICPLHKDTDGHGTLWAFRDRGVPAGTLSRNKDGVDTRWEVSGTGYGDLTMKPSLLVQAAPSCEWHGFITNGEVT